MLNSLFLFIIMIGDIMKTYEVYENGKQTGVLKWFKDNMKKVIAVSVATVIGLTTPTGCSFSKAKKVDSSPTYTTTQMEYDSIDEEIQDKMYFIEQVMMVIKEKNQTSLSIKFEDYYKNIKDLEYKVEPETIKEYVMSHEEVTKNKQDLLISLDSFIVLIEKMAGYKFGVDFIQSEDVNNFESQEEEMDSKEHFVVNVMNDLKEFQVYEIYGKIMQYYEKYITIKGNINSENSNLSEKQKDDTLLDLLNKMIEVIEKETDYKYGIHFLEPVYGK